METFSYHWLHGNAGIVENPFAVLLLKNAGTSLRVVGQGGSTNWIHYAISVPQNALIHQLALRYRCDSSFSVITNFTLHDAEHCIYKVAGVFYNETIWETVFTNLPNSLRVLLGLQLSIGIRFDGPGSETQAIEISSVGVAFS